MYNGVTTGCIKIISKYSHGIVCREDNITAFKGQIASYILIIIMTFGVIFYFARLAFSAWRDSEKSSQNSDKH